MAGPPLRRFAGRWASRYRKKVERRGVVTAERGFNGTYHRQTFGLFHQRVARIGIDLSPAGVNPNVAGGANNYPVIASAQVASGTISGTLNGPANATFTIEFFSNTSCNVSGNGEGATFLGSTSVTTDGTGTAAFNVSVAGLAAGNRITATSTDASGTTSEFSACVPVS